MPVYLPIHPFLLWVLERIGWYEALTESPLAPAGRPSWRLIWEVPWYHDDVIRVLSGHCDS